MNKGFTLIELLVVVLIVGILAAVALPQYTKAVEKARAAEAVSLLGDIMTGVRIYNLAKGTPGTDLNVLDIDIPGLQSDGTAATTNFTFALNGNTATATRAGKYTLTYSVDPDTGLITRTCANATGVTTDYCKTVANSAEWASAS